ncbi:MAG TPA: restriction endonuclease subunit S [Gemmatimonadales bacterium]|nr:restriction endonuclease subunit S [Gemmatimonadales bacterium]
MPDNALPKGWRRVPLREVATIVMGQAPPGSAVVDWNGSTPAAGLPFIQGNAEFTSGHPVPVKWCTQPGKVAEPGDTLISVRAPVGEMNLADQRLAIGRGVAALRFTGINRRFGWHQVAMARTAFSRIAQGSTFTAINSGDLAKLELLTPPPDEQRRIAEVLDSIDAAIEKTEAVIEATERLRSALLAELLTRGVPGWHTEWKQAPGIGTIPACWDVVRLGEVLADGPANGLYKPESDYGSGVWIIRITDFSPGRLERTSFERVRATAEELQTYAVAECDILINRVNSLSHIGKSVLLPQLAEPAIFESNMMKVRVGQQVLPAYAIEVLCSPATRRYFLARAKKAVAQASINQTDVRQLVVPLPRPEEQRMLVEAIEKLNARLRTEDDELSRLRVAKAVTARALLSGKVRVSGASG